MMMKCLTSGTGLISFGIRDSCCALSGTALWYRLGRLDQLPPVPPMPPLHRGSSSPGTRKTAQTAFTYSQLFGLWEGGILNGGFFLKHHWPLLERGCQIFGMSNLIQRYIYFASERSSLCRWKVLHSQMAPGAGAPGLRSMLLAEPCQPLLSWVKLDQFYCQIHPGDIPN